MSKTPAAGTPEYFAMLSMETVEQHIGCGSGRDRVYFALVRCSICHPYQRPDAVRPKMGKRGSFSDFVRALHERIDKKRPVQAEDIRNELPSTNDRGDDVPLDQRDLIDMTKLSKGAVSKILTQLRNEGLLEEGFPFRLVEKPTIAPPWGETNEESFCTGNSTLFRINELTHILSSHLGISLACTGNDDPEQLEATVQVLEQICTAFTEGLRALRTDCKQQLFDSVQKTILIAKSFKKNKETQRVSEWRDSQAVQDSVPTPPPAPLTTQADEGGSAPPEPEPPPPPSELIRSLEARFGHKLDADIAARWRKLPAEYGLPESSVVRFIAVKWEEKEAKRYKFTVGALYEFACRDLPGWIRQNWREIQSDAKWEQADRERRKEESPPPLEAQLQALAAKKGMG